MVGQASPDQDEFARLVRSALAGLYDPVSLNGHPLAGLLVVDKLRIGRGPHVGLTLRARLLEAIEVLKPDLQVDRGSKAWRPYHLIRLRYVEARDPTEVQRELSTSRSQYYRDHERALERLTKLLWAQVSGGSAVSPTASQGEGAESAHHNLALQITSFVGRKAELAQVQRFLRTTRLLTVTGAGGSGKTRLAVEAAAALLNEFQDGVWAVELAQLAEPRLVPQTVAISLGIREEGGQPIEDTLIRTLAAQERLIVLDNCEHLVDACAHLAEALLTSCPTLTIVVTSREPLRIRGETVFHIPTLSTADPRHLPGVDLLGKYEAIQLFLERAAAVQPTFGLTAANAAAVAQICDRLDGIPLAIELAAARTEALSAQQINERLYDRFHLLTGGSRTALPRHKTLRAMVDWSFDLLTPSQKALFCRLSVFAGGWTLDEAEAVCWGTPVEPPDVLGVLSELVAKSLVVAEESNSDVVRYRMLETLRQYASDLLAQNSAYELQRRHAQFFLALAERSGTLLTGPDQSAWLKRFDWEQDNFRAAQRWAIDHEGAAGETALRIATALTRRFWRIHGHYRREALQWLAEAVARHTDADTSVRAAALQMAGALAFALCDLDRASAFLEESVKMYRALEGVPVPSEVLSTFGRIADLRGRYEEASALLRDAMTRADEQTDNRAVQLYWYLGRAEAHQGVWEKAATTLERGIAVSRTLGDDHYAAHCANELGAVVRRQGDAALAGRLHEDSLAVFESLSDTEGIASTLYYLAVLALEQGEFAAASARFKRSLTLNFEIGLSQEVAPCLEGLAALAAARDDWSQAARLLGAAEALREVVGAPLPLAERVAHERLRAALRNGLGELHLNEAVQAGRQLQGDAVRVLAGVPLDAANV